MCTGHNSPILGKVYLIRITYMDEVTTVITAAKHTGWTNGSMFCPEHGAETWAPLGQVPTGPAKEVKILRELISSNDIEENVPLEQIPDLVGGLVD